MHNKELLMVGDGESFKHHILLTVGEDAWYDEGTFGWSHADMGTVDKIPVFDANYRLNELYYRQDTMQLEMFLERVLFRGVRASEIGNSTIKVVTPYTSVLFDTVESGLDILVVPVDGDPLNFKGNVGNTIPIYFDPPPTVIWIQRHSNQSRKKRSSLGGARC
jgi:hypothetical protein